MNILSHPRSLAFGLVLLAAAFGFGGSLACAQAIEPSSALPALEADGDTNLAARPDAFFCVTYYGADENCFSDAVVVAEEDAVVVAQEDNESSAVDEVAPVVAELAPSATETEADTNKVAITESVTIAAPGQEVENSEPESTGSLPSEAATGEPNDAPDLATPARDGTD